MKNKGVHIDLKKDGLVNTTEMQMELAQRYARLPARTIAELTKIIVKAETDLELLKDKIGHDISCPVDSQLEKNPICNCDRPTVIEEIDKIIKGLSLECPPEAQKSGQRNSEKIFPLISGQAAIELREKMKKSRVCLR